MEATSGSADDTSCVGATDENGENPQCYSKYGDGPVSGPGDCESFAPEEDAQHEEYGRPYVIRDAKLVMCFCSDR